MAELAVDIHHFEVHHLNSLVPDHLHDILRGFLHDSFLLMCL